MSRLILSRVPVPGGVLTEATIADALAAGADLAAVHVAAITEARLLAARAAAGVRAALAPTDPAKIAEWELKARLASMPASQRPAPQVAALTTEAAARGLDLPGLLALIQSREQALSTATLAIAAWEAQQTAALGAVSASDPDGIETAIAAAIADMHASARALATSLTGA